MRDLIEGITNIDAVYGLKVCGWAEKPEAPKPSEITDLENVTFITIPSTDTQAVVAYRTGRVLVCFPCTQSWRDVLTDLKANMLEIRVGFGTSVGVHEGFWRAAESIMPQIYGAIRAVWAVRGKCPVWVYGYSLGGALATLCATLLSIQCNPFVVTAGSPKVGDDRFLSYYSLMVKRCVRLVHGNVDPYTTVPQTFLNNGRLAYGVPVEIKLDQGEIAREVKRSWWQQKLHMLVRWVSAKLRNPIDLRNAELHSLEGHYIPALIKL